MQRLHVHRVPDGVQPPRGCHTGPPDPWRNRALRRALRHLRDRVRAQHIVPAMQPGFFWEFGDGGIWNYGRANTMFPVNSFTAAGVAVPVSSDAAVTHDAPSCGLEQALTRKTMIGDVCGPDKRMDLTTALHMHTIHGALASCEEGFKGGLEVGEAADVVVLAEDLSRVPVERLHDVGVVMTRVGGEVVVDERRHAATLKTLHCGTIVRHALVGDQPTGCLRVRQPSVEDTPCRIQQSSPNRR